MFKTVTWNTGPAAMRARFNLKLKKKKRKKRQAASSKPIVYDVDTLQVLGYYRKKKC